MNWTEGVAFRYVSSVFSVLSIPQWLVLPFLAILHAGTTPFNTSRNVLLDSDARAKVAESAGITPNALNQAIYQLCRFSQLTRVGEETYHIVRSELFPFVDWSDVKSIRWEITHNTEDLTPIVGLKEIV